MPRKAINSSQLSNLSVNDLTRRHHDVIHDLERSLEFLKHFFFKHVLIHLKDL